MQHRFIVLTIDQRGSRTGSDLVPVVLESLGAVPARRAFERTAGDELQGVLDDPTAVAGALELLLRAGTWNIGLGIGGVDQPLPSQARAGRGAAYLHARTAVTAAKSAPWHLRVVGDDEYRSRHLETVAWLWAAVLGRRSQRGWEVADLVDQGLSYDETGRRLGISQSAVSQRAHAAGLVEGRRARELVTDLVTELLHGEG